MWLFDFEKEWDFDEKFYVPLNALFAYLRKKCPTSHYCKTMNSFSDDIDGKMRIYFFKIQIYIY